MMSERMRNTRGEFVKKTGGRSGRGKTEKTNKKSPDKNWTFLKPK
jgi:hypothetical protein